MALGRLRRRRAGVDGRRHAGWPSAAGSARWPARRPRRAAPPRPRAPPPRRRPSACAPPRPRSGGLRQLWREAQGKLAQTRDVLTAMERQARETEAKIAAVADAKGRTQEALVEAHAPARRDRGGLAGAGRHRRRSRPSWPPRRRQTADLRTRVSESRTELITLEREHRARTERQAAIAARARALADALAPAPTSRSPRSKERIAEAAGRDRQARRACRPWSSSSARSS